MCRKKEKIELLKLKNCILKKTLEDYKRIFKAFSERYNNVIHQNLIKKYLNNVEATYKYSQIFFLNTRQMFNIMIKLC